MARPIPCNICGAPSGDLLTTIIPSGEVVCTCITCAPTFIDTMLQAAEIGILRCQLVSLDGEVLATLNMPEPQEEPPSAPERPQSRRKRHETPEEAPEAAEDPSEAPEPDLEPVAVGTAADASPGE